MKKTARWIAFLLIAVCLLSGCQSSNPPVQSPNDTASPAENPQPTEDTGKEEIVTAYCVSKAVYSFKNGEETTVTTCAYYENGFLKNRKRNSEVTHSFTYDERGNPLSRPNSHGGTSAFTYDENNNVLTEKWYGVGSGSKFVHTYDDQNRLIQSESLNDGVVGIRETFTYDGNGNMLSHIYDYVRHTDTPDIYRYWTYDENGNMLTCKIFYGDVLRDYTANTYDENGNLATKVVESDGAVTRKTKYTYDENGNLITMGVYGVEFSIDDSPIPEEELPFTRNTFRYDVNGNMLEHTIEHDDGTTFTYSWTYDEQGNMLSYSMLDSRTEWTYDEHGNILAYEWYYDGELVQTIEYEYITFEVPRWAAEIIKAQQDEFLEVPNQWM